MTFRLTQLSVENFRSVRGRLSVDLDAPIVLIHGPNGIGKTSLLSAIELGLTGDVATLSRGEDGFLQHLVHKNATNMGGRVSLTVERESKEVTADLKLSEAGIQGMALLSGEEAKFFSNRCYLAQSTLGRLFDIYQRQDARRSDSTLTKFVKDLLRLDSLDALIDGLYPVGNVSRLRGPAPQFYTARADLQTLESDADTAEGHAKMLEVGLQTLEADIRALAGEVLPLERPIESDLLAADLSARRQADELDLTELARWRRETEVIRKQVVAYAATDAGAQRVAAEQALANATSLLAVWAASDGERLGVLLTAVQAKHADVPPLENGAQAAHAAALTHVMAEIERVEGVIAGDEGSEAALATIEADIVQGQARLAQIDRELVGLAEANQDLANALAALAPHIHTDDCPVCGRHYKEVSPRPLAARLSERIAELSETAARLEALSRDRASSGAATAVARRRADEFRARRLTPKTLATLKRDRAQLDEWRNELTTLAQAAYVGSAAQDAVSLAERNLARLSSQGAALSGHRQQLAEMIEALRITAPKAQEAVESIISRLIEEIDRRVGMIVARQERFRQAEGLVRQVRSRRAELDAGRKRAGDQRRRFEALSNAKKEADLRIDLAKQLADQARQKRTAIVSQVFNHDLNTVWRDLFIRLAPEEDFIPRFKLPDVSAGRVEAELETIYRTGGLGGDPRAMLSAGNLNTAALTLFLALHLSVPMSLPLLIIDDPVQSMDEVHIAQFAALLRTLKAANRQVIIAVHERALFDYLTLELSPAFNGDRLITIDLTRAMGGDTRLLWDLKSFEIDKAFAA